MHSKIIHQGKKVKHPFGWIYELAGNKEVNIALAKIKDDKKHYHKKATEYYYIISGKGKIELDDKIHEVAEGMLIKISPLTRHRIKAGKGILEILVVSTPPYNAKDEFYD